MEGEKASSTTGAGEVTIAHVVERILQQFDAFGKQPDLTNFGSSDQVEHSEIIDESGRFRAWAGNIGAHRTGRSSLNYRLRDASHVESRAHALLRRLDDLLVKCLYTLHLLRIYG